VLADSDGELVSDVGAERRGVRYDEQQDPGSAAHGGLLNVLGPDRCELYGGAAVVLLGVVLEGKAEGDTVAVELERFWLATDAEARSREDDSQARLENAAGSGHPGGVRGPVLAVGAPVALVTDIPRCGPEAVAGSAGELQRAGVRQQGGRGV
jgi:hypothetical protein